MKAVLCSHSLYLIWIVFLLVSSAPSSFSSLKSGQRAQTPVHMSTCECVNFGRANKFGYLGFYPSALSDDSSLQTGIRRLLKLSPFYREANLGF